MAELEITLLKENPLEQEITLDNEPMSNDAYEDGYKLGYDEGYNKAEKLNFLYYAGVLENVFSGVTFPDNTDIFIKLRKAPTRCASMFFQAQNVKSIKLISEDNSNIISINQAFRNIPTLETVDLTEFNRTFNDIRYMCLGSSKLKSIYGALDLSNCTQLTLCFSGTTSLENIEIVPNSIKVSIDFSQCPNLSDVSIQSIIDGLADLTGTATQTVTFHNTVKGKITESQIATITQKNWTLA